MQLRLVPEGGVDARAIVSMSSRQPPPLKYTHTYLQVECVHVEDVLEGVAVIRQDVAPVW